MSKIGRNDLCPCGSNKKYKKCCEATGTYERVAQPPTTSSPEDFGMVIALKPRKKLQSSPAQKLKRAANNQHPDDIIAQAFMACLIPVINACHQAGDAYKRATTNDIFQDFCKLIHVTEDGLPADILQTMLSPFAYLRHFTYSPEAKAFFDDFTATALQHTPGAIDLYNQITGQALDVWEFAPSATRNYTTRVAFTDPATHKSREIDGFFCLSDGIPSSYHLATPLRWRGYDFLLSMGAFEPTTIAKQHTIVDIKNPAAETRVPFYYNEHTAIKYLADPHSLHAPQPLKNNPSNQRPTNPQDPLEAPNAFTKLFK